jgi:prephenate dehydrogenase
VAVLGLGLVGGSLARALTRAGYGVLGYDRRRAVWTRARRAGAVLAPWRSLLESLRISDLIVLAAPPRANLALLRRVSAAVPNTIVTDVSSVKGPICALASELGLRRFVGGHPMAGTERSGFGASSDTLFVGRPWILTPVGRDKEPGRTVAALVRSLGARPVILRPEEHDRALAFLSHLPQLLSWALVRAAGSDAVAGRHIDLSGPAFRDMTRLARSPKPLWSEILRENRAEVDRALRAFSRALRPRP